MFYRELKVHGKKRKICRMWKLFSLLIHVYIKVQQNLGFSPHGKTRNWCGQKDFQKWKTISFFSVFSNKILIHFPTKMEFRGERAKCTTFKIQWAAQNYFSLPHHNLLCYLRMDHLFCCLQKSSSLFPTTKILKLRKLFFPLLSSFVFSFWMNEWFFSIHPLTWDFGAFLRGRVGGSSRFGEAEEERGAVCPFLLLLLSRSGGWNYGVTMYFAFPAFLHFFMGWLREKCIELHKNTCAYVH